MSRADSPLRDRLIFNVGARRSGTFWLQRIITSHPEIASVPSETSLFSDGIAPLFERFHHGARSQVQVGALYLERERLLDATRDFCDIAFSAQLQDEVRYLAERTAMHVHHLPLIAEIYPDARFIHIIRDGRDVARSVAAQRWGPSTIAGAAEEWRSSIESARGAELPAGSYREVRYESLLRDPEREIAQLFEWLELRVEDEVLDQAVAEAALHKNVDRRGRPGVAIGKWRESFSRKDLDEFDAAAGALLRELGYPAAEAAEAPARRRRLARSGREWVRRGICRVTGGGLRPSHASSGNLPRRRALADRALAAILAARPEELSELLAPNAVVRIVTADGDRTGRGDRGRALLADAIGEDALLAGRQLLGDHHPAHPTSGYVLRLRGDQPSAASDRAIFITMEAEQVTRLTIYRFPLGGN